MQLTARAVSRLIKELKFKAFKGYTDKIKETAAPSAVAEAKRDKGNKVEELKAERWSVPQRSIS